MLSSLSEAERLRAASEEISHEWQTVSGLMRPQAHYEMKQAFDLSNLPDWERAREVLRRRSYTDSELVIEFPAWLAAGEPPQTFGLSDREAVTVVRDYLAHAVPLMGPSILDDLPKLPEYIQKAVNLDELKTGRINRTSAQRSGEGQRSLSGPESGDGEKASLMGSGRRTEGSIRTATAGSQDDSLASLRTSWV